MYVSRAQELGETRTRQSTRSGGGMQPGFRPRLLKARPSLLELMRASNSQERRPSYSSVSDAISEDNLKLPAPELPADDEQQLLLQEIASHPLPPETPATSSSATFTSPPSTPAPPFTTTSTLHESSESAKSASDVPNHPVTPLKMPPVSC